MFGGIGIQEILVILVVGLLVFGAARLPKIAKSLGLGIREFKKTIKGLDEDDSDETHKVGYSQQGYNQNNQPQQSQYNQQYNQWQGPQQPNQGPNMYQNPQQPPSGQNPYQAPQQPYGVNSYQNPQPQQQNPYGDQSGQTQQQQASEFNQGPQGQPPKPGV